MKKKFFPLVFLLSTLIAGVGLFSAQNTLAAYPEKAVSFFCGFPAGGPMDMTARTIAEAAKKYFPQPMAVVNLPGAAGTIAAAEVIRAKPDGYTIGLIPVAVLTIQPHRTNLPFGSPEGYTPIIKLVNVTVLLTVENTARWKTIQELIAYCKANPGKIRVGHGGIATLPHLDAELLQEMAKIDFTTVPFAGGAEGAKALLGGHVEAYCGHPTEVLPHVQAGKLRVLGLFEEKRNPLFPNVPTFKEIGFDITMGPYYTVIAPKGISPQIVSTLHDAFKKAMEDPIFTKPMVGMGFNISYEGSENLKKRLLQDYELNEKLIKRLDLKGK